MSNETSTSSSRRILSRNKANEDDHRKSDSVIKSTTTQLTTKSSSNLPQPKETKPENPDASFSSVNMQQQQILQHNLAANYINKEPFNEDIEIEECNLYQDMKWKTLVMDKFREIIDEIKKLQSNPGSNVFIIYFKTLIFKIFD